MLFNLYTKSFGEWTCFFTGGDCWLDGSRFNISHAKQLRGMKSMWLTLYKCDSYPFWLSVSPIHFDCVILIIQCDSYHCLSFMVLLQISTLLHRINACHHLFTNCSLPISYWCCRILCAAKTAQSKHCLTNVWFQPTHIAQPCVEFQENYTTLV